MVSLQEPVGQRGRTGWLELRPSPSRSLSPARKIASMTFWFFTEFSSVKTRVLAALRGAGEGLDLEPVLLGSGKAENGRLGVVLVVQLDAVMVVEPGIEGRMHLDEALVAVEHHHLARRHLGRQVEGQFEVAEIGADRRIDIGPNFGSRSTVAWMRTGSLPVTKRVETVG